MLAPVLLTPPAALPVSLAEAKSHLRVDHDEDDALIGGFIAAAVGHLDGWSGILGRCLVTQTWRVGYAGWWSLRLPFPDVQSVVVRYRDAAGVEQTVAGSSYFVEDGAVRFVPGWSAPALYVGGPAPVSVDVTTGFGDPEDVPWELKTAVLLHVGTLYQHRETLGDAARAAPTGVYEGFVSPWRAVRV